MKRFILATLVILLGITLFANAVYAADHDLMVNDPWVREAPPNTTTMAAYFAIVNHTGHGRILVGASSPQFEKAELHHTEMDGVMARMMSRNRVQISIGQTVNFEPGGLHLMLINPVTPLKAGDSVEIILRFSDGESIQLNAPVKKDDGGVSHGHMHMSGH